MHRSTLVTQATIIALCSAATLFGGMPLLSTLIYFVTMEIAALAGMWWGRRLRARAESMPIG